MAVKPVPHQISVALSSAQGHHGGRFRQLRFDAGLAEGLERTAVGQGETSHRLATTLRMTCMAAGFFAPREVCGHCQALHEQLCTIIPNQGSLTLLKNTAAGAWLVQSQFLFVQHCASSYAAGGNR